MFLCSPKINEGSSIQGTEMVASSSKKIKKNKLSAINFNAKSKNIHNEYFLKKLLFYFSLLFFF